VHAQNRGRYGYRRIVAQLRNEGYAINHKTVYRLMKEEGLKSKMILQVHDELNFSVLPEEKERLQKLVIEEMQGAANLSVPLIADCGWGSNWLEAH
jgi:DNA polymerase I-like protein with 3'-5' exonuclease and polymerase domains